MCVMDPLLAIVLVILAAGVYLLWSAKPQARWRGGRHWVGIFFVALPTGALAYLFAGIEIARWKGVGHFYSVPFGGYAVRDSALLASFACWVALVFVIVAVVLRRREKPPA
jgi:hypothetical protein